MSALPAVKSLIPLPEPLITWSTVVPGAHCDSKIGFAAKRMFWSVVEPLSRIVIGQEPAASAESDPRPGPTGRLPTSASASVRAAPIVIVMHSRFMNSSFNLSCLPMVVDRGCYPCSRALTSSGGLVTRRE